MKDKKLSRILESVRKKGRNGDTILAHINPMEAAFLKSIGGSGTINPETGLPEFWGRIITNPIKTITKAFRKPTQTASRFIGNTLAPIGGAIVGNMLLPGVGGIIGGGLGGGVGAAAIGKKFGSGVISGALTGALLPTAASVAGWGAKAVGARGIGATLSNYGNTNAILPSISRLTGLGETGSKVVGTAGVLSLPGPGGAPSSGVQYAPELSQNPNGMSAKTGNIYNSAIQMGYSPQEAAYMASNGRTQQMSMDLTKMLTPEKTFFDKTTDYLSSPANLLTTASVANSFLNRPKAQKELSPEERASQQNRYERTLQEGRASWNPNVNTSARMNKTFEIKKRYRKDYTPEEYAMTGRWFDYFDNPNFTGQPIGYAKGGRVSNKTYYDGITKGQDDKVPTTLREGDFVLTADVVSSLGDGNSRAGANILQQMVNQVSSTQHPTLVKTINNSAAPIKALVSDGEFVVPKNVVLAVGQGDLDRGAKVFQNLMKKVRNSKNDQNRLPPRAQPLLQYMN